MTDMLNLTLRDLRRAEPLIRRKEKLLAKLQGINRQLETFSNGRSNGHGHAPFQVGERGPELVQV